MPAGGVSVTTIAGIPESTPTSNTPNTPAAELSKKIKSPIEPVGTKPSFSVNVFTPPIAV